MKYIILLLILMNANCSGKKKDLVNIAELESIEDGKFIIKKSKGELPATIRIESIKKRNIGSTLYVPVRVSCVNIGTLIFETTELTEQYTDYLNSNTSLLGAKISYQRQKEMYEEKVTSEKELLEAKIKFEEITRNVKKIESNFHIYGIPIEIIKNLKSGWALLSADIPESKVSEVHTGMQVVMQFNALPEQKITGVIFNLSAQINPITRSKKALIKILNTKEIFSTGMFGTGLIEGEGKLVLSVPLTSVVQIGNKAYVFKQVDKDTIERIQISTGPEDDGYVAVNSGVVENDKIVTSGADLLKGLSFGY